MRIKNISGSEQYFGGPSGRGVRLANNAEGSVADEPEIIEAMLGHAADGSIEIVDAPPSASFIESEPVNGYALVAIGDVIDTDTLTVEGVVFEFDADAGGTPSVTGDNTPVLFDTDSQTSVPHLVTAINADTVLDGLGVKATDVVDLGAESQILVIECQGSLAAADLTLAQSGGTMTPETPIAAQAAEAHKVVIKTQAALATTLAIPTGFATINYYNYRVEDASGTAKNYDGDTTVHGGTVHFDAAGTVDLAATDVVTLVAYGK